jgi:hypothetical protein
MTETIAKTVTVNAKSLSWLSFPIVVKSKLAHAKSEIQGHSTRLLLSLMMPKLTPEKKLDLNKYQENSYPK